jgi:hypothetical protein
MARLFTTGTTQAEEVRVLSWSLQRRIRDPRHGALIITTTPWYQCPQTDRGVNTP